jgi:hypothetical protein
MTALHLVNGHPTLIVLSCRDFHATDIGVYAEGNSPYETWSAHNAGGGPLGEVQLFTVPKGWTTVPLENSLNALAPGATYGVAAYDEGRGALDIVFTLADLTALPPGQVLVGDGASRRHSVAESTFRADARDACN